MKGILIRKEKGKNKEWMYLLIKLHRRMKRIKNSHLCKEDYWEERYYSSKEQIISIMECYWLTLKQQNKQSNIVIKESSIIISEVLLM
jgi:hypothetical protein